MRRPCDATTCHSAILKEILTVRVEYETRNRIDVIAEATNRDRGFVIDPAPVSISMCIAGRLITFKPQFVKQMQADSSQCADRTVDSVLGALEAAAQDFQSSDDVAPRVKRTREFSLLGG